MTDLTDRQVQILRAVVEEYTQTAEAVGSETLDKKYNLGVSPATIRNEMAYLVDLGYLKQPHTSAGRVPTPAAVKLYIKEMMKERSLTVAEEVSAKERVWEKRTELGEALRATTQELAQRTGSIGIALTDDMHVYHAGYAHILDLPEFFDILSSLFSFTYFDSSRSNYSVANTISIGDHFHHRIFFTNHLFYTLHRDGIKLMVFSQNPLHSLFFQNRLELFLHHRQAWIIQMFGCQI